MIIPLTEIVLDPNMRGMCRMPYPNHPKGCPNFNHKKGCPPTCPEFALKAPWFAIVNEFDFSGHVERMKSLHPDWTERQLECCLYWQPKARKALAAQVKTFKELHPELTIDDCPEAGGMNVTETLRRAGVELEWPPKRVARQVVIAGMKVG